MGMRKIILAFLFICLFTYISAEKITNLKIPSTLYAGEYLKISGTTTSPNIWCSFIIYDVNGYLVDRATDELSNVQGDFVSNMLQINEPPFFRGSDYNVAVNCGEAEDSNTFTVANVRPVDFGIEKGWEWGIDRKNLDAFFFWGGIFLIAIILIVGVYYAYKVAKHG